MVLSQSERNHLWRLRHPERYRAKQQRDYAQRRRERAAYELLPEVQPLLGVLTGMLAVHNAEAAGTAAALWERVRELLP